MTLGFDFNYATQVRFGPGRRSELPDLLQRQGWTRIGLVVDHNLRGIERVTALIEDAQAFCETVVLAWCEVSEPTYDSLESARTNFVDDRLQAIVGVGGGSALDMAKAMAVLVHNRQPALRYRGFDQMTEPVLPVVAIPTTAGTGSEVTPNASFVDSGEQRKLGINGEAVRPRFALLDPELTLSCPEGATVSAGVDSLVHATEAYVAKKSNPLARLLAREGFGLVFNALPRVVESPDDLGLRSQVMYGAFLAGVALMNSGTGPSAAMSYPLGVFHQVPHGVAGAVFLPAVVKHNVRQGIYDYADLYQTIDGANRGLGREEQAAAFVECFDTAWKRLRIPRDLGQFGVIGDQLERLVTSTLDLKGALEQNPSPFGRAEIEAVLRPLVPSSNHVGQE